jgi:small subunit ribosomal protein S9
MPTKKVTPKPAVKKTAPKVKDYVYTVGRRKTATARVRLYQKKGDNLINGKTVAAYFPSRLDQDYLFSPLTLTNNQDRFFFTVKVAGSGYKAQRDAVVHGLARALVKIDTDAYRSLLKKAGFLTRDPRMKESRKVGMGGKARRKKQSPKR